LIPITLLAPTVGLGGMLYVMGAVTLGLAFLALSLVLFATRSRAAARALFFGSLAYLPLLLALMILDPTA